MPRVTKISPTKGGAKVKTVKVKPKTVKKTTSYKKMEKRGKKK